MKKKNIKKTLYGTLLSVATFTVPFSSGVKAVEIKESTTGTGDSKIENGSIILGISKFSPESTLTQKGINTAVENETAFKGTNTNSNVFYFFNNTWYNITSLNKPEVVKNKETLEVLNNAEIYYVDNVEKVLSIPYNVPLEDGYSLGFKSNDSKKDSQILYANNELHVPATIKSLDVYLTNEKTGSTTLVDTFIKQRGNDDEVEFTEIVKSEGSIGWDNTTGKTKTIVANVIKNALYFDGEIAWYERTEDSEYGNYVGAIITAPADMEDLSKVTLTIDGEETTWSKVAGTNDYFNYRALVSETIRSHKIVVNWSESNSQEFTIDVLDTATLAPAVERIITFETFGGELENNTIVLPYGTKYSEFPVPTKENYEFIGWYAEEEFTNKVTSIELLNDTTLYANYIEKNYTISFDEEGIRPITAAFNSLVDLPTPLNKEGYKFAGWYIEDSNTLIDKITVNGNVTLHSSWIKLHKVTYMDGLTTIDTKYVEDGDTFNNAYVELIHDDEVFTGWALEGTNEAYDFATPVTNDIVLVAMWEPKPTYTVVFDKNYGEELEVPVTQTIVVGSTTKLLKNGFTRPGYAFLGWSSTPTDGTEFNFVDEAEVKDLAKANEEVTLYAVWLKGSYNITYTNKNDFTLPNGVELKENYTVTDTFTLPTNLTYKEAGYVFTGWTGTDLEVPTINVVIPTNSIGAREYTANFEKIVYNVTFIDGENQTVIPADYNELVTAPEASKAGYTFLGWFEENANEAFDLTKGILANTTLTAKYAANNYTIVFDSNAQGEDVVEGTMNNQAFTYDKEQALTQNTYTSNSYNFKGWSTTPNGEVEYTDGEIINLVTENNAIVTVYAVWESKQPVNVTFYYNMKDANENDMLDLKTIPKGTKVTRPVDPTRDGYTFGGWYTDNNTFENAFNFNTKLDEGIELFAKWVANPYTITYISNGGTNISADIVHYGDVVNSLPTITRDGYHFDGWYIGEDKVTNLTITNSVILEAKWTEILTVTFDDGNTETVNTSIEVLKGTNKTLEGNAIAAPAEVPYKEGYTFKEWQLNGEAYDFSSNIDTSITLVAAFDIENYTITYTSNIEGVSFEGFVTSFNVETPTFTINVPTIPEGYIFKGWTGTGITDAVQTITISTGSTINREYTANFNKLVTATYKNEDGTDYIVDNQAVKETVEVINDNKFSIPTEPTKTGYTFEGWYQDLTDEESQYNFDKSATDNVTLYAKFSKNKYNIIYHSNTEANYTSTQENVEYDTETTLSKNTFTKDGFKFVGWATTATGGAIYDDEATINDATDTNLSTGDNVDLYAVWAEISRYIVSFNTNGGTAVASKIVKEGEVVTEPNSPTREGYTFAGWTLDNNAYDFSNKIEQDIILVANWNPIKYTITFNGVEISPVQVDYNTEYVLAGATKEGSTFLGWYTDSNYTTKVTKVTVTKDIELYARFDSTPFEVDNELMTLEDALNLLKSETETAKIINIKLLDNVTLDGTMLINQKHIVNLDLNGKTLKSTNSNVIEIKLNASLYINDTIGTGKVLSPQGKYSLMNNGTTVLYEGYYGKVSATAWSGYVILNHGKMTVKSGVTVENAGDAYYSTNVGPYPSLFSNGYYDYFSGNEANGYVEGKNQANPTLIIDGGEFIGGKNTIKNDDGAYLTINGGHFTNNIQVAVFNWNVATINDGTFEVPTGNDKTTLANGYYSNLVDNGMLTVNGGTFKGEYVVKSLKGEDTIPTPVKITGGTFENTKGVVNTANNVTMGVEITGGTFKTLNTTTENYITLPGSTTDNGTVIIVKPTPIPPLP